MRTIVNPAAKPKAEYREWDPLYPSAVRSLVSDLMPLPEYMTIEHVGSSAVSGCGGKGVIDLLALYQEGFLTASKEFLLSAGFCPQGREFLRPWPSDRPMLLGAFLLNESIFTIYVHVVNRDSDEVRRFRLFRDRLSSDAGLVAAYCEVKRRIISDGVTDTDEYAVRKRQIIQQILGVDHKLKTQPNKIAEETFSR